MLLTIDSFPIPDLSLNIRLIHKSYFPFDEQNNILTYNFQHMCSYLNLLKSEDSLIDEIDNAYVVKAIKC